MIAEKLIEEVERVARQVEREGYIKMGDARKVVRVEVNADMFAELLVWAGQNGLLYPDVAGRRKPTTIRGVSYYRVPGLLLWWRIIAPTRQWPVETEGPPAAEVESG